MIVEGIHTTHTQSAPPKTSPELDQTTETKAHTHTMRMMLLATTDRELSEPFEDKDAKLVTLEVFDNNENNLRLGLGAQVSSDCIDHHHHHHLGPIKPTPIMSTSTYYPSGPDCARTEGEYYSLGPSAVPSVVPNVPTSAAADLSDFHDVSIPFPPHFRFLSLSLHPTDSIVITLRPLLFPRKKFFI